MRRSEDKRLQTMRHVTLMAASYLFIVIPVFAGIYAIIGHDHVKWIEHVKDILLATMPVAAGIMAYWFGDRPRSRPDDQTDNAKDQNRTGDQGDLDNNDP